MIHLDVSRSTLRLPRDLQGLISNALTRAALQQRALDKLDSLIASRAPASMLISEPTLDWMMVKYSEQAVFNPRREIQHWFAYSSGAHIDPGYPPLFYFREKRNRPSPNKSAVAAIGEGIAGFLAQRLFHCVKLARPNHDYPDIVMDASHMTYLVEAKATLAGEPEAAIDSNLLRFVSHIATAELMDVRPVKGLLISTGIETESQYRVELVEVEIAP